MIAILFGICLQSYFKVFKVIDFRPSVGFRCGNLFDIVMGGDCVWGGILSGEVVLLIAFYFSHGPFLDETFVGLGGGN